MMEVKEDGERIKISFITNPLDLIYGNTYRKNDVNNDG